MDRRELRERMALEFYKAKALAGDMPFSQAVAVRTVMADLAYAKADKILALIPDVQEAKREERERIKEGLESWIMGMGFGNEANVKYDWQVEWDNFWQALKEKE